MQKTDSVIFDLDGVLWDTSSSCAIAWNKVLERRDIPFRKITAEDVRKVTGKPHDICIRETFLGLNEDDIKYLIQETMIEDNAAVAELGGNLYAGVVDVLNRLQKEFPLFIVSNCQSGYIETFLKLSGLAHLFQDFECWGNTRKSKSENLAAVISRNSLKNSVYIGDAEGDRVAARSCKIPFYFASYGFGTVKDYDLVISSFPELADHLLK